MPVMDLFVILVVGGCAVLGMIWGAVRLATLRYTAGLSSYVEVLDAQQQLFPAQNALSQARLSRLLTLVQLYKDLGGGWNIKDEKEKENRKD